MGFSDTWRRVTNRPLSILPGDFVERARGGCSSLPEHMTPLRLSGLRVLATLVGALTATGTARAQSTISISMDAAPATPRLLGPFLFGARPTTPLVFAIPATGQSPLAFAATGL